MQVHFSEAEVVTEMLVLVEHPLCRLAPVMIRYYKVLMDKPPDSLCLDKIIVHCSSGN